MRVDRHIAFWLAFGAAALAVSMMAAPALFPDLPRWILELLFWGGLSAFALSVLIALALAAHDPEGRRRVLGPVILMGSGAVLLAGGAIWYALTPAFPIAPASDEKARAQTDVPRLSNEAHVYLECAVGPSPRSMLPDGRMYNITIMSEGQQPMFAYYFGPPGGDFKITNNNEFLMACQCALTNYSKEPIFNVETELLVEFVEAITNEDGRGQTGGSSLALKTVPISIPKIDVGLEHSFKFFVFNLSNRFVTLRIQDRATFHWSGGKASSTVEFDRPKNAGEVFLPPVTHPPN